MAFRTDTPERASRELTYILRRMFAGEEKEVEELATLVRQQPRRWPCLAERLRAEGGAQALVGVAEGSIRDGRCRFIHNARMGTLRAAPRGGGARRDVALAGPTGGGAGVVITIGLRHCSMPQLRGLEGGHLGETEKNLLRAELCGQGWDASAAHVFDARYLHDHFRSVDTRHCGLHPPTMENILEAHREWLLEDLAALAEIGSRQMVVVVCKSGKHRAPAAGAMLARVLEEQGEEVALYHASAEHWYCDCCWQNPRAVSAPVAEALAVLWED